MASGEAHVITVERILSSRAPVVLLVGPAASGKTSAVLALHRRYAAEAPGRCLLLVPTAAAVAAIGRRLLAESPAGVAIRPQVMTFTDLAGLVLAGGEPPGGMLSHFRRHLLLREIVDSLLAEGKLPALGRVADTPGLPAALDRAIAELKRAAVEPERLAKAIDRSDAKAGDLLAVYRGYQQRLHRQRAFDLEGLMWLARDRLTDGKQLPAGLAGAELLAVDGFTDFTPTQLEMLRLLSGMVHRIVITLPHGDDGRDRMWQWAARTADGIHRAFAGRIEELRLVRDPSRIPPLSLLWDRLFDFDAAECALPAGLNIIAASGLEAEVAAVARRVKRLLLAGAAPGSVAVLARSIDTYRPTVERVFADFRIPIRHASQPLTDAPIIRFILAVAALPSEYGHRDVLAVIKSSYFRPPALGEFSPATVAAAEFVIRYGNVFAGRAAYSKAARRLADALEKGRLDVAEDSAGSPAVQAAEVRRAGDMLEGLFTLCESAAASDKSRSGDSDSGRGGLAMIADHLQLCQAACDHDDDRLVARDLRALAALEGTLAELPRPAPPIANVRQALAAAVWPAERGESAVDVMDVLDARTMSYRHVFCMGMGEGQFPGRFQDGSLISERDRADWAKRGVKLDTRGDLVAREMLLFYLAASRAQDTLTLSFMETDAAGRPAEMSSFVQSLLEPAGKFEAAEKAGRVERIPPGTFLPPADELACDREAVTAAVAGLFHAEYDPAGAALGYVVGSAPRRLAAAAGGLFARHRRWRNAPCDAFDGRIGDAELLKHLAGRFGREHVFSASQLNTYGECPWQFFATYVLSLRPTEAPTDRLTPLDRGLFCHKVLFTALSQLAGECRGAVHLDGVDRRRLLETLDHAVADESAHVESRGLAYPALWRLQRKQMRDDLAKYLLAEQEAAAQLAAESVHFELGFGLEAAAAEDTDAASAPGPVTIDTPTGSMLLRGKIDRVDRIRVGDLAGLTVVDYKTGRVPGKGDIDAGRSLQVPLYSLAAGRLMSEPHLGGAYHQIGGDGKRTCLAAFKARTGNYSADDAFESRLAAAIAKAGQFVQSIRGGRFDVLPTHECPSYCPFRQICHYVEHRAALKVGEEDLA